MSEPYDQLENQLTKYVQESLRELLQKKHLYQNFTIDPGKIIEPVCQKIKELTTDRDRIYAYLAVKRAWMMYSDKPSKLRQEISLTFKPYDVKLFCTLCDRTEAYNLVEVIDIYESRLLTEGDTRETVQVFTLSYLCQSCKSIPEVFLICREGYHLILSGRTPMEYVDVPKVIPESIQKFYSGAVVAHQSGHTLAGNFYLRTLLEQWTRSVTKDMTSKADVVIEVYMGILPDDFKAHFYSMRELYGELSEDIHNAKGSSTLFDKGIEKIIEHFDARRVLKIK